MYTVFYSTLPAVNWCRKYISALYIYNIAMPQILNPAHLLQARWEGVRERRSTQARDHVAGRRFRDKSREGFYGDVGTSYGRSKVYFFT